MVNVGAMTPQDSIQSSFLDQVRSRLPANLSFVDELAEILNISRDSAYRRMRGETILSLDEVKIICNHFGVSLDSLLSSFCRDGFFSIARLGRR